MTSKVKCPELTVVSPWNRISLVSTVVAGSEDDTAVAAMRSDPRTRLYLPFFPPSVSAEEWKKVREERALSKWDFHARLVKLNEQSELPAYAFAAQCTIMHIDETNKSAELGLIVRPDLHRTGIATEMLYLLLRLAFEHPDLKLHRAYFTTGYSNVQMKGWFEAYGILQEFRLREAWSDGKGGYVDAVGYSVLDWEWGDLKERLERKLDARLGPRSG